MAMSPSCVIDATGIGYVTDIPTPDNVVPAYDAPVRGPEDNCPTTNADQTPFRNNYPRAPCIQVWVQGPSKFDAPCISGKDETKQPELDEKDDHSIMTPEVSYDEDPPLRRLVQRQRWLQARLQQGDETAIRQMKHRDMRSIVGIRLYGKKYFHIRFQELKQFKETHGHCNVPAIHPENQPLGTWVKFLRRQYNLHKQGRQSFLTLARILELEALGFHQCTSLDTKE